ncbi:(2Fe-2S)-binding protein [Porticoccaceae bacterium]|nr:(2Fe-2S)-binding protein [Porticoccaceae bacterium]
MASSLTINGEIKTIEVEPDTPLLWVIRDHLQLTGTKFGCGIAQCGACTIHLDGQAVRSCVMPVSAAAGKQITTIEGLSNDQQSVQSQAVQQAWNDVSVVQCGYCQSGQIMSATALLTSNPSPSDQEIDDFMSGNICRCATYVRIKKAIKQASNRLLNVEKL